MSAILFDMDGTLIDSEPLWLQAEIEVMAAVGCKWDGQDQINCLGGPLERTEKYMQERSNHIKPYGYFGEQLFAVMEEKLTNNLELIPNALELLEQCKDANIKVALVTASSRRLMQAALKWFPESTFLAAVSRDDVEVTKPDPAPYLLAAKLMGVDIKNCLVFEDSITGAQSGLRSGAQVIGIPHLIQMPDDPNLRVVKSLSDIDLAKLLDWYPFLDTQVSAK